MEQDECGRERRVFEQPSPPTPPSGRQGAERAKGWGCEGTDDVREAAHGRRDGPCRGEQSNPRQAAAGKVAT